jgi:hypothetical protein
MVYATDGMLQVICYRWYKCAWVQNMLHGRRVARTKPGKRIDPDQAHCLSRRIRFSVSVAMTSVIMGRAACLKVRRESLPSTSTGVRSQVAITELPFSNYKKDVRVVQPARRGDLTSSLSWEHVRHLYSPPNSPILWLVKARTRPSFFAGRSQSAARWRSPDPNAMCTG